LVTNCEFTVFKTQLFSLLLGLTLDNYHQFGETALVLYINLTRDML